MHFHYPAFLALLSATLTVAAPAAVADASVGKHWDDSKKYWDDKKWEVKDHWEDKKKYWEDKKKYWDDKKKQWDEHKKYEDNKKYEEDKKKNEEEKKYEEDKKHWDDKKKKVEEIKSDWEYKCKNNEWKGKDKKGKGKHGKYFDAEYEVLATPDQVVNNVSVSTPGQEGAKGVFKYGINIDENTICYYIVLTGVTGEYRSPAVTATHIHEGPKGRAGPPRLAFPNPEGPKDGSRRVSKGCLKGPFFVGVPNAQGVDNAAGFHVKQIVENPSGFFTDSHTEFFPAGAVRGQLA